MKTKLADLARIEEKRAKKLEELQETVCELCHKPYVADSESELEQQCEACPVLRGLDELLRAERTRTIVEVMRIVQEEMCTAKGGKKA